MAICLHLFTNEKLNESAQKEIRIKTSFCLNILKYFSAKHVRKKYKQFVTYALLWISEDLKKIKEINHKADISKLYF